MLKQLFYCFALLLSLNINAKTIVVSDIDDTLKIAHIRSTTDTVRTAFKTHVYFKGMPGLLKELVSDGATVYYLSNAPKFVMESSHRELLKNGNFPQGRLLLKSGIFNSNHKIKSIKNIIKSESPDTLILIGDNGEKDPTFYKTISNLYPNLKMHTYIRAAYPLNKEGKIFKGQESFITPVDIALSLRNNGTFSYSQFALFATKHIPFIMAEKANKDYKAWYLPKWLSCRGHKINVEGERALLKAYATQMEKRCGWFSSFLSLF